MGGIAGHAGLFSTASDLSIFAQMMLNGGIYNDVRIVAESTVTLFTRRTAGHRALGWDTAMGEYGSGQYLTDRAYGHTGYTGTSIWIDPDREMFVILLTNRVHAARALHPLRVISDVRADLSDAAALAVMDMPNGPLTMPDAFRADRAVGWNDRPVRARRVKHHGKTRTSSHAKALSSKHGSKRVSTHSTHATASKSKSKSAAKHRR
jgi:CubicO group peptidase (beta-lactamase class C family)